MNSGQTDAELVDRTLSGDQQAYGELIDRYQRPIYNHALKTLRDKRDAEDVTQTVFMKAYQHLGAYDPKYKFFSWIYRIVINESINEAKRQRIHDPLDDASDSLVSRSKDVDSEQEILDAMMHLAVEDRAIISLKHFENFSYSEIEFIMDIPVKTVKSRLYSARQRLKEILIRERKTINE